MVKPEHIAIFTWLLHTFAMLSRQHPSAARRASRRSAWSVRRTASTAAWEPSFRRREEKTEEWRSAEMSKNYIIHTNIWWHMHVIQTNIHACIHANIHIQKIIHSCIHRCTYVPTYPPSSGFNNKQNRNDMRFTKRFFFSFLNCCSYGRIEV